MALHEIYPMKEFYNYALDWANSHEWGFRSGNKTRNADDYCAAQTYMDLYNLEPKPEKLTNIKAAMQKFLHTPQNRDWIDTIQMEMPLNKYIFENLDEVREQTQIWMEDFNTQRPMAPIEYAELYSLAVPARE